MIPKLLIVDDERTARMALAEAFSLSGYDVSQAASGDVALTMITAVSYDVVILDLQMPGIKGGEVLAVVGEMDTDTAFIVLTAHASTDTAITALRSGAVDYLRKPSTLTTIFAAVEKALVKQQERKAQKEASRTLQQIKETLKITMPDVPVSSTKTAVFQIGAIHINKHSQTVTYRQKPLDLTPIQYQLLHTLSCQPNTIISYAELAYATHDAELNEEEARTLLRTHVYRLSRKLGDKENSPIQSVRGRGVILYIR